MSRNNTQVEEVSGCVIGLGIRSGNKTGGGGAKIEVLEFHQVELSLGHCSWCK